MKLFLLTFLIIHSAIGELYSQLPNSRGSSLIIDYLNTNGKAKKKIANQIIKQNLDFDSLYIQIKRGKDFSNEVQKGFFEHNFKNALGIEHPNLIFIPYKYNPEKKYQVRLFLHGGVSSFDKRQNYSILNRVDTSWNSVNTICLFPSSWLLSPWWSYSQYENLTNLISYVKTNYNINENDIYITGISDGGTGIYYLSNFLQTPFSCYLPFIGSMETLSFLSDKQFYIKNYQGLSFLIVNGKNDEVFNIHYVARSVHELKKTAKEIQFFIIDSSGHSMNWYPYLKDTIKNFIKTHKRNPFPDNIYYATEKPDTFNRKFWVIINKIGKSKGGLTEDSNKILLNNQFTDLFPQGKFYGQIEVTKLDNTIHVTARNVKKYTLLIAQEHFDLKRPIVVYTNRALSFEGLLTKSERTLLKYNLLDNDRTMLFSTELNITVGKTISK